MATADSASGAGPRRYASLNEALRAHEVPEQNHALLHQIAAEVEIAGYFDRGDCIKAERVGGGPALNIAYGWTNGFRSQEEAFRATRTPNDCWPSQRGSGQWGVSHPVHRLRDGNGPTGPVSEEKICSRCNYALPASGRCDYCD